MIYCGTKNLMSKVPVAKVKEFEIEFLSFMRNKYAAELASLKAGKLSTEATEAIESAAAEISSKY
jgi:F-type H+-transporting ATPase subunit alpha